MKTMFLISLNCTIYDMHVKLCAKVKGRLEYDVIRATEIGRLGSGR